MKPRAKHRLKEKPTGDNSAHKPLTEANSNRQILRALIFAVLSGLALTGELLEDQNQASETDADKLNHSIHLIQKAN